jgi:hypothetical protein
VLEDLLAAYYMTVATALTTSTGVEAVVALITFVVGKVERPAAAAVQDSPVPAQQIPEDLTQTLFTGSEETEAAARLELHILEVAAHRAAQFLMFQQRQVPLEQWQWHKMPQI